MSDRLIEVLVQRGAVTAEEADAARERQVAAGGAIDTALLEGGIDPRALRASLADAFDARVARPSDLQAPEDARALRTIPEQWARRHQLAPIAFDAENARLTVLSPAPVDLAQLLRLSELLEVHIEPRVALELDVERVLARLYGLQLPERFAALRRAGAQTVEPIEFRRATQLLERADTRDSVARALLGFGINNLAYACLLVVHETHLRKWMSAGAEGPELEARTNRYPIAQMVLESQSLYLGPRGDDPLGEDLGRGPSRAMVMAPLRIRTRTVALFFGDNGSQRIPESFGRDLTLLLERGQRSLESLLIRKKSETWSQLSPAPVEEHDTDQSWAPVPDVVFEDPVDDFEVPIEEPLLDEAAGEEPLLDEAAGEEPLLDEATGEAPLEDPTQEQPVPELVARASIPADDEGDDDPYEARTPPSLPDEPIYGNEDDDWEPVALARANFAQGYELVSPSVLPRQEQSVATAPKSSRDLPRVEPIGAPRKVTSADSWSDATPWPDESEEANTVVAEDQPRRKDASGWSEPGVQDPSGAEPVLLTKRSTSVDLLFEDLLGADRQRSREARERLWDMGPSVVEAAVARFPGRLVVEPFGPEPILPFPQCGPLLDLLAKFGRDAHPKVAERLEATDPVVRYFATYFYAACFIPEVIPRLMQRLHDEETRICMLAARTLFGYRDRPEFRRVLEHLHGRLASPSAPARRHAAYLVGLFRDVSALPALIDIVKRKDRETIEVVRDALIDITKQDLGWNASKWHTWFEQNRDRSRVLWLIDGLDGKNPKVRASAAEELRGIAGQDFGFDADAPRRRRDEAKQRWLQWWEREGRA